MGRCMAMLFACDFATIDGIRQACMANATRRAKTIEVIDYRVPVVYVESSEVSVMPIFSLF